MIKFIETDDWNEFEQYILILNEIDTNLDTLVLNKRRNILIKAIKLIITELKQEQLKIENIKTFNWNNLTDKEIILIAQDLYHYAYYCQSMDTIKSAVDSFSFEQLDEGIDGELLKQASEELNTLNNVIKLGIKQHNALIFRDIQVLIRTMLIQVLGPYKRDEKVAQLSDLFIYSNNVLTQVVYQAEQNAENLITGIYCGMLLLEFAKKNEMPFPSEDVSSLQNLLLKQLETVKTNYDKHSPLFEYIVSPFYALDISSIDDLESKIKSLTNK